MDINKYKNMNEKKDEPILKGESLTKPVEEKHVEAELKPRKPPGMFNPKDDPLYAAKKKSDIKRWNINTDRK